MIGRRPFARRSIWLATVLAAALGLGLPMTGAPAAAQGLSLLPSHSDTMIGAAEANDADKVKLLLAKNVDPDFPDNSGRTALITVASNGNLVIAKLLVEHGAKLNAADTTGNAALHYAADRGNADIVELLCGAKAPIDQQNKDGATPLMLAAARGRVNAVKSLIAHGANVKKTDYTGRDAVGWAQERRQTQIINLLRQAGAK